MDTRAMPETIEASEWFVVFHPDSKLSWVQRLCPGRFKHVSAWGYYPGFKAWMIFDPQWNGLRLSLIAHGHATEVFADYTRDCDIVKIKRIGEIGLSPMSRLGFWCVPAIKQLLGVRCAAVFPDALYRAILHHGGILIES